MHRSICDCIMTKESVRTKLALCCSNQCRDFFKRIAKYFGKMILFTDDSNSSPACSLNVKRSAQQAIPCDTESLRAFVVGRFLTCRRIQYERGVSRRSHLEKESVCKMSPRMPKYIITGLQCASHFVILHDTKK